MSNSTKVWLFLTSISIGFLILGYTLGERLGLFISFLCAVGFNVLIFFYGHSHIPSRMNAIPIGGQDAWGLNDTVEKFAKVLGIEPPRIFLLESKHATAFSMSTPWRRSIICISKGALDQLSQQEVDAVIAHEACHIRKLDSFSFSAMSNISNAIIGFGNFLDWFWPGNWQQSSLRQKPFSSFFSPLAWLAIRFVASEKSFFENDALAASLLHEKHLLAETLWKLEGLNLTRPLDIPPTASHLFIVNPLGLNEKNFFLKTHPKIEKRIRRLVGYYPI